MITVSECEQKTDDQLVALSLKNQDYYYCLMKRYEVPLMNYIRKLTGMNRPDAEDVRFTNSDGLSLHGCYFKTPRPKRRGVIVFGLEFGSDCWSAWQYCEFLIEQGFDVFSFETRNQGSSQKQEKYRTQHL